MPVSPSTTSPETVEPRKMSGSDEKDVISSLSSSPVSSFSRRHKPATVSFRPPEARPRSRSTVASRLQSESYLVELIESQLVEAAHELSSKGDEDAKLHSPPFSSSPFQENSVLNRGQAALRELIEKIPEADKNEMLLAIACAAAELQDAQQQPQSTASAIAHPRRVSGTINALPLSLIQKTRIASVLLPQALTRSASNAAGARTSRPSSGSTALNGFRDAVMTEPFFLGSMSMESVEGLLQEERVATRTTRVADLNSDDDETQLNQYLLLDELGRGVQGVVYLAFDEDKQEFRAIKEIKKPLATSAEMAQLKIEIDIMKRLRHRSIVPLYEVINDPKQKALYLVMQYMEKGPLVKFEDEMKSVCSTHHPALFIDMAKQLASGLKYLHNLQIYHRDIKPDNVLIGEDDRVYFADFGVAHMLLADVASTSIRSPRTPSKQELPANCSALHSHSSSMTDMDTQLGPRDGVHGGKGTPCYFSPEVMYELLRQRQAEAASRSQPDDDTETTAVEPGEDSVPEDGENDQKEQGEEKAEEKDDVGPTMDLAKVDIWALGETFYMALVGHHPFAPFPCQDDFPDLPPEQVYEARMAKFAGKIFNDEVEFPPTLAPDWKNLLTGMLEKDPEHRFSLATVKKHLKGMNPLSMKSANDSVDDSTPTVVNTAHSSSPALVPPEESETRRGSVSSSASRTSVVATAVPSKHSLHGRDDNTPVEDVASSSPSKGPLAPLLEDIPGVSEMQVKTFNPNSSTHAASFSLLSQSEDIPTLESTMPSSHALTTSKDHRSHNVRQDSGGTTADTSSLALLSINSRSSGSSGPESLDGTMQPQSIHTESTTSTATSVSLASPNVDDKHHQRQLPQSLDPFEENGVDADSHGKEGPLCPHPPSSSHTTMGDGGISPTRSRHL